MQPPHGARLLPDDGQSLLIHFEKRHFRAKKNLSASFSGKCLNTYARAAKPRQISECPFRVS